MTKKDLELDLDRGRALVDVNTLVKLTVCECDETMMFKKHRPQCERGILMGILERVRVGEEARERVKEIKGERLQGVPFMARAIDRKYRDKRVADTIDRDDMQYDIGWLLTCLRFSHQEQAQLVIALAMQELKAGATHDCGEWADTSGQCLLCDRKLKRRGHSDE